MIFRIYAQNFIQKLILSTLLTLLFMPLSHAQDWQSQNGNTTVSALNEVQFVTDQVVYAVGNTGAIIKSTDGGESWNDISYGDTKNMLTLFFFDVNNGLVGGPFSSGDGGSSEMLAKTTDGGETWEVRSSFDFEDFNDLEFLDDQNGYAASIDGIILHTSDGGETWSSFHAGTEDLLDLEIVNDTTFWVSGEVGSLYKTTNGGTTREPAIQLDTISVGEFETLSPYDELYGVAFATDNIGYVIGKKYSRDEQKWVGVLLGTHDAGKSWSLVDYDFQHLFYDIEIGANGEIVLAGGTNYFADSGNGNAIYISEDEGATWKVISDGNNPLFWNNIDRIGNSWIAVGESGTTTTFTLSEDTLTSNLVTGYDIAEITLFNNSIGAFITSGGRNGKIFTTTDGGESYTESFSLEGRKDFISISFADENNIWAVGNDHFPAGAVWLIYYSSDQGQNWNKIELDYPVYEQDRAINKVQFIDNQNGFIKAGEKLLKTTDGGNNWTEISDPVSISFGDYSTFQFLDGQNG